MVYIHTLSQDDLQKVLIPLAQNQLVICKQQEAFTPQKVCACAAGFYKKDDTCVQCKEGKSAHTHRSEPTKLTKKIQAITKIQSRTKQNAKSAHTKRQLQSEAQYAHAAKMITSSSTSRESFAKTPKRENELILLRKL